MLNHATGLSFFEESLQIPPLQDDSITSHDGNEKEDESEVSLEYNPLFGWGGGDETCWALVYKELFVFNILSKIYSWIKANRE